MARKKEFRPLFAVKHDFVDALDNMTQQVVMLIQSAESLLDLKQVAPGKPEIEKMFRERLDAVRKALLTDE